ncbi:transposase [Chryseobacterium antibioticum]|uniref:Transposase n=1 Tax=Chryseobacterium pyrolae TaxID=2987481 RepID=A0ABT2IKT3_9FLAO|nr:transposase [Chryseobacterium pyrolae]MCT2409142.1 transposase [Chryseobacterium pyrolae]
MKNIHIGKLIETRWRELNIPIERTCRFFKLCEEEIYEMFRLENMNSHDILKWCKLLDYDFFRLYSQHLILYSPQHKSKIKIDTSLPKFRKSIYTKDIIDFILSEINDGARTKAQISEYYRIPKTTLYKWIAKYSHENNDPETEE